MHVTRSSKRRSATVVAPGVLEIVVGPRLAPGPDDLVIAPQAVGICGTDLEILSGTMSYISTGLAKYPLVPGHEWSGVVVEVGSNVTGFEVGDIVVGECSIGCGTCDVCNGGQYHLCPTRTETGLLGRDGALSTMLIFPAHSAHKVPPGTDVRDAALIEPLSVAYRALIRAEPVPGEPLAIVGGGTIGILAGMVARALGLGPIHVVERRAGRREFAESLGFSCTREGVSQWPLVLEASGTPSGVSTALSMVSPGGTVILCGLSGRPTTPVNTDRLVVDDIRLIGSQGSPDVWPEVIALMVEHSIRAALLVSHEFALDDVARAFEVAASAKAGVQKVLIRPQ